MEWFVGEWGTAADKYSFPLLQYYFGFAWRLNWLLKMNLTNLRYWIRWVAVWVRCVQDPCWCCSVPRGLVCSVLCTHVPLLLPCAISSSSPLSSILFSFHPTIFVYFMKIRTFSTCSGCISSTLSWLVSSYFRCSVRGYCRIMNILFNNILERFECWVQHFFCSLVSPIVWSWNFCTAFPNSDIIFFKYANMSQTELSIFLKVYFY